GALLGTRTRAIGPGPGAGPGAGPGTGPRRRIGARPGAVAAMRVPERHDDGHAPSIADPPPSPRLGTRRPDGGVPRWDFRSPLEDHSRSPVLCAVTRAGAGSLTSGGRGRRPRR